MKQTTAQRKSNAGGQSWNKHIDAFHQCLANKRIRRNTKNNLKKAKENET